MANDLNRSIKIYIDGTEAANGVKTVEAAIQKLEAKLGALNGTEANYATRSKQLQKEIEAKNKTLQTYKQKIEETDRVLNNLSGATYNQLIAVQSQVRKQLRDAVPSTQQHTAALEQNRRVTEALASAQAAMRVEVGSQGTTWSKAAGFVNKYMALIGGVIASITGISMTIRRSVEDYAQVSEAMAGVKKYTGMTDEAVRDLNESFKSMDTRTPRERLNELAQDAGRLGIKGKQDILDFVDAANTINVALGEDLGQDAVKNIGKLAQMFGDDEKLGLRGAMLATGSAINEVAQNSSAAESYLVDFTARVAGTGKQAGISQSQIMGFASVLDQDMQQVEMAATALQTVIMKVYQEPATFAKMAGKDVKEFTELLKTDANEAILTLLENLGSKGGLQELAPLFKDMKLDGVRASGVINTLAANVGRVREEQERATAAYKDGTSVINEFNVQNNTVQAKLEKAKKGFQEISYELGEKLSPYMSYLISTTGSLVRVLSSLIDIFITHAKTIGILTTIIGGYILISKAQIIEEKLKFFWQEKVIASMKQAYAVMLRNPYAAVAAAVLLFIVYLRDMNKELTESERIEKTLTGIRQKSTDSVKTERAEVEQLLEIARNENISKGEREAAIRRLNELSPDYLGNITLEKINTDQATAAVNSYVDSLIVLEEIKRTNEKMNELRDQKDNILKKGPDNSFMDDAQAGAANMLNQFKTSLGLTTDAWADNILDKYINKGVNEVRSIDNELQALNNHIEESRKSLIKIESEKPEKDKPLGGGSTETDDEKAKKELKSKLDAENILHTQHQAELKALYLSGQDDTLQTEKQFSARMEQLQLNHQQRIIKIAGEKSKEGADAQNAINDIKLKQRKEQIQQQIDEEKLLYDNQQNNLKRLYSSGKDENLNSEAAYNEAMQQLAMMHLERMLQIANLDADQRRAVEKQLLDFKVKCMQDEEKERKKLEEKDQKNKDAAAKRNKQRLDQQAQQYSRYGQQIGETLGQVISGQENAMQAFADTMLDVLFDVLAQIIEIEIAKATGVAVGAVARASAESFAQADSVATFGATGAIRTALLSGLIMGALATAKSALKGMIGGKGGSSSNTSGSDAPKTAQVQVKQWASGRYDVIGQDDGKSYNDVPYIGPAPTGIVRRTSLISENGAELIINAEDLSRLQKHIDYPVVVQAIQDSRSGRVPQRAEGNYTNINATPSHQAEASTGGTTSTSDIPHLISEIIRLIAVLGNLKAYVVLRDLHNAEELDRKSKEPFTRSKQ